MSQDLQESITDFINQMAQLLQAIQPLLDAACTILPAVATMASVTATFALSPGATNPDQLIDYSTRTGDYW